MKYFILTVDTEGDNLWDYKKGDAVHCDNVRFIPRFQQLCERYGIKPVYLTNYEIISDYDFVKYISPKAQAKFCEVGIHIHAWNNPPLFELDDIYHGNPYLIEYPYEIMSEKLGVTYNLIKDRIGIEVKSHRAGRWAMDDNYFALLKQFNIPIDCSFTPFVNWKNAPGATVAQGKDYSHVSRLPHYVNGIFEVPLTVRKKHLISNGSIRQRLKALIKGNVAWARPATQSAVTLIELLNEVTKDKQCDYVEFMIHSSELMPGGSPYFKTEKDIERLYKGLEQVFVYATTNGYEGVTLEEYYNLKR